MVKKELNPGQPLGCQLDIILNWPDVLHVGCLVKSEYTTELAKLISRRIHAGKPLKSEFLLVDLRDFFSELGARRGIESEDVLEFYNLEA